MELVEKLLEGNRRALARLLTMVENQREGVDALLTEIFPHTGKAHIIGITGAPGTGKSSLVNSLAKAYRAQEKTVGIVAVDPTSPFTGGAILGDRIRMNDLSGDRGVFIRSMATRGSLGGLSRAVRDAVRVMDAGGFDIILIETVGAGQSEVDIVRTAETTLVVEAPGLGDDVQAIKAGILEIADVLVVNKADRPGVKSTVSALKAMLELGHPASRTTLADHHGRMVAVQMPDSTASEQAFWLPPIIQTIATDEPTSDNSGIPQLVDAIGNHRKYLNEAGIVSTRARQRIEIELHERLLYELMARLREQVPADTFAQTIDQVMAHELDPQSAVNAILSARELRESSS